MTNAEKVARIMVPPINLLSTVVSPLGIMLSWLSKQVLYLLGFKGKGTDAGVSDSELRLIVMGARDSGTIDHSEGEMIKGVLNLQSQRVKEIMRPRVGEFCVGYGFVLFLIFVFVGVRLLLFVRFLRLLKLIQMCVLRISTD